LKKEPKNFAIGVRQVVQRGDTCVAHHAQKFLGTKPPRGDLLRDTARERDVNMFRTSLPILALVALMLAAPLLGACHTTAGAGEDISATGHAIDKAATKATP
jgi:predicted small secreted protein